MSALNTSRRVAAAAALRLGTHHRGPHLFGSSLQLVDGGALWLSRACSCDSPASRNAFTDRALQGPEAGRGSQGKGGTASGRDGPGLGHFLRRVAPQPSPSDAHGRSQAPPFLPAAVGASEREGSAAATSGRTVYLETYGCQMNVSDSQVVLSILGAEGYHEVEDAQQADVVLLNTCAIRENAESKIWSRLGALRNINVKKKRALRPTVGVLGCMAERLKEKLLESNKLVDLVVGPDAYRDLPRLLSSLQEAQDRRVTAMNVQLSLEETYADVMPVRRKGSVSAYLSIMRGCNNMCSFCIVPFTRGRERSRDAASIVAEVEALSQAGVKEVTLLGQNVNSYADHSEAAEGSSSDTPVAPTDPASSSPFDRYYAPGFTSVYKPKRGGAVSFGGLLDRVARVDPEMRIRFTSPHPKDFTDDVLQTIARHSNICSHLHMPAQSGSSAVLHSMRRGYTREAYDSLIARVREVIPEVSLSTDIIAGFCGESEADHAATLDLMRFTGYDQAFMFAYSRRDKTHAAKHLQDDVPEAVKQRRLAEVIAAFREGLTARNAAEVGRRHIVLVEGTSKRGPEFLTGRTCSFKRAVFPAVPLGEYLVGEGAEAERKAEPAGVGGREPAAGDYVAVQVVSATAGTLTCVPLGLTTIGSFVSHHGGTTPRQIYQEVGLCEEPQPPYSCIGQSEEHATA